MGDVSEEEAEGEEYIFCLKAEMSFRQEVLQDVHETVCQARAPQLENQVVMPDLIEGFRYGNGGIIVMKASPHVGVICSRSDGELGF